MLLMKNQYLIDFYRIAFLSLRQKVQRDKVNLAKPLLLLSVFEAIENCSLTSNRILYNEVKPIYEEILQKVQNEPTPVKYPFFYLKSDGFWKLEWKNNFASIPATPSDKFLRENLAYAMFDQALWDLLQDSEVRNSYRDALINYFKMNIEIKK